MMLKVHGASVAMAGSPRPVQPRACSRPCSSGMLQARPRSRPGQALMTRASTQVDLKAAPSSPLTSSPIVAKDPWKALVDLEERGETVEVVVRGSNKGGLLVALGELKGFLPYNQLASESLRKGHAGDLAYLVGQKIRAKITSVDIQGPRKEIIFSERKVAQSEALRQLKVGAVMRGIVTGVEEYGAFVSLLDLPGVNGLVHKSEVSWTTVDYLDSILRKDQRIKVKVLEVDSIKCRLALSIKQLTLDPLKQTLDTLQWGPSRVVPPEIQKLADQLCTAKGIIQVVPTRQAQEASHVSQELQVYMTKSMDDSVTRSMDDFADSAVLVARLGPMLQELQVTTEGLTREDLKEILQKAVKALTQ